VVRGDEAGEKHLVAYVAGGEAAPGASELRQYLSRKLPDYMVPSVFLRVERIPRTINGKVDYRALPAPDATRPPIETPFVAPRNDTEEALAHIWSSVLSVERVGVQDDFFELGGNSLSATRLVLRIREAFDAELPLRALFKHSTVAELASLIEEILLMQVDELTDEEAEQLLKEGL
jgi:acyl carrier protein